MVSIHWTYSVWWLSGMDDLTTISKCGWPDSCKGEEVELGKPSGDKPQILNTFSIHRSHRSEGPYELVC